MDQLRIDPAYREQLAACGLHDVEAIVTRVAGRVAAWSRTTDTLFVEDPAGGAGVYVKRYFYPRWRNRFRAMLRGTFFGRHRGQAEYLALRAMREQGICAVRPIAYGARRRGHFVQVSFLITEAVPDAVNLTTFAQQVQNGMRPLNFAVRRALLAALAQAVAQLHAEGLVHGQLFWRNTLVRFGPDGTPEYFFLDAEGRRGRMRRSGDPAGWLRDLGDLATAALPFTTRLDRLRFLETYQRESGHGDVAAREVSARLAAVVQRGQGHELQRIKMNDLFENWSRRLSEEQAFEAAASPARAGGGVPS